MEFIEYLPSEDSMGVIFRGNPPFKSEVFGKYDKIFVIIYRDEETDEICGFTLRNLDEMKQKFLRKA